MAAEKVNFAQTCNLLSQYLKEMRTPTTPQVPTTMNLLTNMEINKSDQASAPTKPNMDLFPQFVRSPEACLQDQQPGSAAPMTIFYGGQVLIFNEIQSEKAMEIMGLATKGGGSTVCAGFVAPEPKTVAANPQRNIQKAQPQVVGSSDLPIARRSSLHKFLAKRKERVAALAPYQVNYQRASSPAKNDEQMSSKDQVEDQSSKQLELRL